MRPKIVLLVLALVVTCKSERPKQVGLRKVVPSGPGLLAPVEPNLEDQDKVPTGQIHTQLSSHAGLSGHGIAAFEEDGSPLPLKKTGLGSAQELEKALQRMPDEESRKKFEEAFRLTFCTRREARDLARAKQTFEQLAVAYPNLAEPYRGLAFVALSQNFDVENALRYYQKALDLRPDYGEVHYALAMLYARTDRVKGEEHLRKALALGIQDSDGLSTFYGVQREE